MESVEEGGSMENCVKGGGRRGIQYG
jgi:hypothetical protein